MPLAGEYEALLAGSERVYDFPDFDENTCATTFYTTGTTGLPKGVYFSHRQLVLHTLADLSAMAISRRPGQLPRDDVYMPLTPMFHVHAWGYPTWPRVMGVKQVYPGRYEPAALLGLIAEGDASPSRTAWPRSCSCCCGSPAVEHADLTGWKVIIGGGPLPTAFCREALARGSTSSPGTASETCPFIMSAHLPPDTSGLGAEREVEIRCRAGRPNPLVDLRVVDDAMRGRAARRQVAPARSSCALPG